MATNHRPPDRNLALELVRVTEAGAMGAGRWIGRGDKIAADQAAVDAMRAVLDTVQMRGVVVIGEGEKDEAPMLYNGEEVGGDSGPEVDVAVDPLEGTRLTALGQPNAISTVALAERGTMFFPGAAVYMEKIACGPEAAAVVDLDAPPADNVRAVAEAKGVSPREVSVVVLDRPRHEELVGELREVGAKVLLIPDGDVAPAIAAAQPGTGVDLLMGIGGTPEGVLSAAALKCVGGALPWPALAARRRGAAEARRRGLRRRPKAQPDDLVAGRGRLLRGDRGHNGRAAPRRALLPRGRGHRLDRDALTLGHRPPRRGDARAREAHGAHRPRIPVAFSILVTLCY